MLHSDDIRSSVHETGGKRMAKTVKSKVRLKLGEMNSFFEALFQIQNPLSGLRLLGKTNSELLRFWSSRSRFSTARFIGMVRSANFVSPLRMRIVRLFASNCVQRFGHRVLQNVHLSVDCSGTGLLESRRCTAGAAICNTLCVNCSAVGIVIGKSQLENSAPPTIHRSA